MKDVLNDIASCFLCATKEKFVGDYREAPTIKNYWHNITYLFFSFINARRLSEIKKTNLEDMVKIGIMPDYLLKLYYSDNAFLDDHLQKALELYYQGERSDGDFRQRLLNVQLDFSDNELSLYNDKVNRDSTGSYYTSTDLCAEVVRKIFENGVQKSHKIIDLSCGGGEFFVSVMDYLEKSHGVNRGESASWFYGVDIDPIALQICVTNILECARKKDWKIIVSHFFFGNPLVVCNATSNAEKKNELFSQGFLYAKELGMPDVFFETEYDVVVGNPPWEKIRFEERKFFRGISNRIASISRKNIRAQEIELMREQWPQVYNWRKSLFEEYKGLTSKKFKHCKIKDAVSGELNTYVLFTELAYNLLSKEGVLALIVKSTLVTAPAHSKLWVSLLKQNAVSGVFVFDNKKKIFNIDSRERFILFMASKQKKEGFHFAAGLTDAKMLRSVNTITLTMDNLISINPKTKTLPNVTRTEEIEFLKRVHREFKLFMEVHKACHFGRLIHLTAHASSIDVQEMEDNIPIYEGKFIEQYDGRFATFRGMGNAERYTNKATARKILLSKRGKKELPESRYYVKKELWERYQAQYGEKYSLCWRSLTSPTNKRTMIAMILPTSPTCQSIQMLQTNNSEELLLLLALFNSIPFDYLVRIKMPGLDLTQSVIRQIPVPDESAYSKHYKFNGINAPLKKHILSYAASLIKDEDRLSGLLCQVEDKIYNVCETDSFKKKMMIDIFYKNAYHLDDNTYEAILCSFPKYQEGHTS